MKICLVNTAIMFFKPWINNRIKKDRVTLGFLDTSSSTEVWGADVQAEHMGCGTGVSPVGIQRSGLGGWRPSHFISSRLVPWVTERDRNPRFAFPVHPTTVANRSSALCALPRGASAARWYWDRKVIITVWLISFAVSLAWTLAAGTSELVYKSFNFLV